LLIAAIGLIQSSENTDRKFFALASNPSEACFDVVSKANPDGIKDVIDKVHILAHTPAEIKSLR
jgi:hypothetical protein